VSALGDARAKVVAALASVGVPVFGQPPGALQPPAVVLLPGGPWIAPRGQVTLEVVCYANPAAGNTSALTQLEDMVEAVRGALWAAGLAPGDTDRPVTDSEAGALSALTAVTLRTACS
jgi:hypothetical protein